MANMEYEDNVIAQSRVGQKKQKKNEESLSHIHNSYTVIQQ